MTAFDDDPLLTVMTEQTDLLLHDVGTLRPDEVRASSLLPGWSRGHVLSHLARNADALGNLVSTALTGVATPMYPSREARERDIQDGAVRTVTDLEADLESASERFLAGLADLSPDQLDQLVPNGSASEVRVRDLPWLRTVEVVFHHVDLDSGFTFADAPALVVERAIAECGPRLSSAPARATVTATLPDGRTVRLDVGSDGGAGDSTDAAGPPDAGSPGRSEHAGPGTTVSGSAAAVLAWATGRSDGGDLDHDGPLPDLPAWG